MTVEECTPPPRFHLPPPPRPPYLPGVAPACPFHSCSIRPVIDAEYHSSPALPSLLSISIGSALVLLTLLLFTALVCKHQKKMRNFLPCKTLPQSHCDISHQNGGVIYEDMTNIHPRTIPQAPIEMLDVKRTKTWLGYTNPGNFPVLRQPPVFICPPPLSQHHQYSQDLYNPVYEELSNCSESKRGESEGTSDFSQRGHCSEDEFAEDESSVAGYPPHRSQTQPRQSSARSGDRKSTTGADYGMLNGRRTPLGSNRVFKQNSNNKLSGKTLERRRGKPSQTEPAFHEGLLLDALFQLYPNRPGLGAQFPCILPIGASPPTYDRLVKKLQAEHTSVRQSNDSDSGYSHNTSEGHGSTVRTRDRSHYIPDSPSLLL